MVIRCTESSWRPVAHPRSQYWVQSVHLNDLGDVAERTLRKLEDTEVGGEADTAEGHAAIHRDLHWLQKWAGGNLEGTTFFPWGEQAHASGRAGGCLAHREGPGGSCWTPGWT